MNRSVRQSSKFSLDIPRLSICNILRADGAIVKMDSPCSRVRKDRPLAILSVSQTPPSSQFILALTSSPLDNQRKPPLQGRPARGSTNTLSGRSCLYRKPASRAVRCVCDHSWSYYPSRLPRNHARGVSERSVLGETTRTIGAVPFKGVWFVGGWRAEAVV